MLNVSFSGIKGSGIYGTLNVSLKLKSTQCVTNATVEATVHLAFHCTVRWKMRHSSLGIFPEDADIDATSESGRCSTLLFCQGGRLVDWT